MTKSAEDIRNELKKRREKKGKYSWVKLREGAKVYIRIGPPWKKNGEFWKDILYHGRYPNKVYCRKNDIDEKTNKPKKCPVCIRVAELKGDRSTTAKKLWSLIKQNSEGLWNVLVAEKYRKSENGKVIVKKYENDNKFQLLRLSTKWQALVMDIFADEDYRTYKGNPIIQGVTHPKYGRLIKATREGSGRDDTNYIFTPVDRVTPIFEDKEKRIKVLKSLIDLDSIVRGSSREECEAFVEKMEKKAKKLAKMEKEGGDEEDEEEDDETGDEKEENDEEEDEKDEKESEDDDDDEAEEEEDDESDDDDLEKKYKKMKKNLKSKKRHKEDDEDED